MLLLMLWSQRAFYKALSDFRFEGTAIFVCEYEYGWMEASGSVDGAEPWAWGWMTSRFGGRAQQQQAAEAEG